MNASNMNDSKELSKTNIVSQPRRMTLKPEDAISPNRFGTMSVMNKSPLPFNKGLTLYSQQKSIISGKSAQEKGKPDLKTFVNVFHDLNVSQQK